MKTAISVPDPIFQAADDLAKRLGMSRSQLYTTAVSQYLQAFDDEAITAKLNEVYTVVKEPIDPYLVQMQAYSLPKEDWE